MAKESKNQKEKSLPTEYIKDKTRRSWVGDLTYPIRDVLLASMSNGLFLIAILALIIVIFVYRLPNEQLLDFAANVYKAWINLYVLGWVLWILTCAAWLFHWKYAYDKKNKEIMRLSDEKNKYQRQLFAITTEQ